MNTALPEKQDEYCEGYAQCEWPTYSYYQGRLCGRGAVKNDYGPSLCWQHADAAFKFVVQHLERGNYPVSPTEDLAQAILESGHFKPNGSPGRHPDIATFVEEQLIAYLECLVREGDEYFQASRAKWWKRDGRHQIDRLIDALLEQRINAKFGKGPVN
jgi:hypothetical protein